MLDAQTRTVTVLFCDVRGFSGVSERLDPADSLRWINDVMYELSDLVLKKEGVVVDYVGDEVMAMWGAPEDQPDQAERAVRSALAMLGCLPAVNARWAAELGTETRIGIGVNTGPAQVGNTGSRVKFKYRSARQHGQPRQSRPGADQVSETAVAGHAGHANSSAPTSSRAAWSRRGVVNIENPVDLYEVEAAGLATRRQFFAESEAALQELEEGRFAHAASRAGILLLEHPEDGALQLLLSRACTAPSRTAAASTRCGRRRGSENGPRRHPVCV